MLLGSATARSLAGKIMPWFGIRPSMFKPEFPNVNEPRTGLSMGQSNELTAKQWGVTREAQDQLAYTSHMNAAKAYEDSWAAWAYQGRSPS